MNSSKHKLQIACVGSPFGADRFAWQIYDLLLKNTAFSQLYHNCTDLCKYDRPGLNLLEYIAGFEYVIIVDAIISDQIPGTILTMSYTDGINVDFDYSTHQIGVFQTLAMGAILRVLPRFLVIMGMVVRNNKNWKPTTIAMNQMIHSLLYEMEKILNPLDNSQISRSKT